MTPHESGQTEIIFLVEEDVEGGFNARALGYPIFTQADSFDALREMITDAIHCHFDDDTPRIIRLHYIHDEVIYA